MGKTIDYYFSLVSPWTYLGAKRLEEIAAAKGATIRVKPVSLAKIFPQSGGLPLPKRAPQRQAYRLVELERWSKVLGEPITIHPAFFPADERLAAYCVIAAGETGGDPLKLAHAILRAVWVEERNIADEETLAAILKETGHDPAAILKAAKEPAKEEAYDRLSQEALEAGVFGSPSYVVEGELFWGQDRLDFLERAL
jgi:2-hydroxychromene-2-carboxylate isomerase